MAYTQPLNYQLSPTATFAQVVQSTSPVYLSPSGNPYFHMSQLGYPQFTIQETTVTKFGRQPMFLPYFFADIMQAQRPSPNYVGYRNVGREILVNGLVRSTVTGNGTGLRSVQLKVALEGGTGGQFLTVGSQISSIARRAFTVIAESLDTDGFQLITVEPNDARYDLSVTGGVSDQFPDTTLFGIRGVTQSPFATQDFRQLYTGSDQRISYKLTRKFMDFRRDGANLQNDIRTQAIYPFLSVPNPEDPGKNITYFYFDQEMKEMARFYSDCNSDMLYGQENLNQNAPFLQGSGLVNLMLPEYKRTYTAGQVNATWFRQVLFEYRINNPDMSDEIVMVMGDAIYDQLMDVLDRTFRPNKWVDPVTDTSQTDRYQFVATPNRYTRFLDIFGTNVRFINLRELNTRRLEGLRSPLNPNISIASHDFFILDPGPLKNYNLSTGQLEAEKDRKINFFCAMNGDGSPDSLRDIYSMGALDQNGNYISNGPVVNFNEFNIRRLVNSFAMELADPYSAMYYRLG